MLSFLSPLFLLGAAAVAIPIAIHLLHRRVEPVIDFPATRYLRSAPAEESHRRRLRELLLLALRVTALLLLAGAFARPYLSDATTVDTPATLVLVDTSASVSGPGQFERAVAGAREVIRDAPPTDAVGIVAFAGDAQVLVPLSPDRAAAMAALAQVTPGAGATRYRAAVERAAEEFGGRPGRMIVVTDLQQSGWDAANEQPFPGRVQVEVVDIGGPDANLAVVALRLDGGEAVAIVQNFSTRPASDQVVFAIDERRVGAVPIAVEPGASTDARLPLPGPGAGVLTASITDREGFAADNIRYAVLDPTNRTSILAITASGHPSEVLYLERAVAVAEGVRGFLFRAVGGREFSDMTADALSAVDVIVVLGTRGLEQRGRQLLGSFVKSGGGLLLTAARDVEPAIVSEALDGIVQARWRPRDEAAVTFAPEDSRHPVFRRFGGVGSLANVVFTRAALLDTPAGAHVIARYSDGTSALVDEQTAGGRVLLFASDLNNQWNDFPLQPAFVPFVHETLRYLASTRAGRAEYFVGDFPGAEGLRPGVAQLQSIGHDTSDPALAPVRRVAVNIDPRESDPTRMGAEEFRSAFSRQDASSTQEGQSAAQSREHTQRLWQYALLLMVVGLIAEGMMGRRFA